MDSSQLIALLRAYCPSDPAERSMLAEILHLIQTHPADCAHRSLLHGHLTASAWILNANRTHVLMTHHRKLNRWLQLGGHADGDLDLPRVALREAREESGLNSIRFLADDPFDVDIHNIPARKDVPQHLHYDVRFLFTADDQEPLVISNESLDLAWLAINQLEPPDASIQRLIRKTQQRFGKLKTKQAKNCSLPRHPHRSEAG
jgi:8-oxo-dGTP pyrophosphatase MutT (NUDIX family)